MRTVEHTTRFKRDYRREKAGRHGRTLDEDLVRAVQLLADDMALPHRYFDHALSGEWHDCRDCHIRPDLILIYRKPDDANLELVRLGSHRELGLGSIAIASRCARWPHPKAAAGSPPRCRSCPALCPTAIRQHRRSTMSWTRSPA